MSWRKLAAGSGSTDVEIAGNDVNGATENRIALGALLNPSMWAVFWDIDDDIDDRAPAAVLAGAADEA